MTDTYILDADHRPVKASLMEWARWRSRPGNHRVALDVTTLFEVSTVFIGMDMGWGKGPPILFETMVFEREHEGDTLFGEVQDCWRYSSWDDALTGHQTILRRVRKLEADALSAGTPATGSATTRR